MSKLILEVKNLNIKFADNDRAIVKNGNFKVNSGEIVLILGENGSGKSSIFRALVGEIHTSRFKSLVNAIKSRFNNLLKKNIESPLEINIERYLNGQEVDNLNEFRKKIGYVRQHDDDDEFFQKKVWDNVKDYVSQSYYYSNYDESKKQPRIKAITEDAQSVYDALDCDAYAKGQLKKLKIKHLSGGEKRITTILSALARKHSELFILDEPVNNLDGYHARVLSNYLIDLKQQENAPGILIITHCPMFPVVDRVYALKDGKLLEQDMNDYHFQTCFGKVDKNGKYIV